MFAGNNFNSDTHNRISMALKLKVSTLKKKNKTLRAAYVFFSESRAASLLSPLWCRPSHSLSHPSPLLPLFLPHSPSLGGMSHRRERRKRKERRCVCVRTVACARLCARMCRVIPPEVLCPSHSFSASCQPSC